MSSGIHPVAPDARALESRISALELSEAHRKGGGRVLAIVLGGMQALVLFGLATLVQCVRANDDRVTNLRTWQDRAEVRIERCGKGGAEGRFRLPLPAVPIVDVSTRQSGDPVSFPLEVDAVSGDFPRKDP